MTMLVASKLSPATILKLRGQFSSALTTSIRCDCTRSGYARVRGRQYLRLYPTMLVYPDGSTITVRCNEPREIIKLPLDLNEVDEATRIERLALRKRSKKVELVEEDIEDTFDSRAYKFLWKDKKVLGKKN